MADSNTLEPPTEVVISDVGVWEYSDPGVEFWTEAFDYFNRHTVWTGPGPTSPPPGAVLGGSHDK